MRVANYTELRKNLSAYLDSVIDDSETDDLVEIEALAMGYNSRKWQALKEKLITKWPVVWIFRFNNIRVENGF